MSLKASGMRVIGHLLSKNVQQVGQRTFRRAVTRHTRCMSSIRAAPGEPFGEAVKRWGIYNMRVDHVAGTSSFCILIVIRHADWASSMFSSLGLISSV